MLTPRPPTPPHRVQAYHGDSTDFGKYMPTGQNSGVSVGLSFNTYWDRLPLFLDLLHSQKIAAQVWL